MTDTQTTAIEARSPDTTAGPRDAVRSGQRPSAPSSRFVRLSSWLRGGSLDRALIAGADASSSRLLTSRSSALVSRRFRGAVADGLDRWLVSAATPPTRWHVTPYRAALRANAGELTALVALLRGPRELDARGIAMLNQLLSDGSGPAALANAEALGQLLREAHEAL